MKSSDAVAGGHRLHARRQPDDDAELRDHEPPEQRPVAGNRQHQGGICGDEVRDERGNRESGRHPAIHRAEKDRDAFIRRVGLGERCVGRDLVKPCHGRNLLLLTPRC